MVKRWRYKNKFFIVILIILPVVGIRQAVGFVLEPVNSSESVRDSLVRIPQQSSTGQVADILKQLGLIRSSQAFRFYSRYYHLDSQLKAGYYLLNESMSTPEIIHILVHGKTASKTFTIPEGYTLAQITGTITQKGLIREDLFKELLAKGNFNYSFLKGLPPSSQRLEGYLFPATYNIGLDGTEKDIINAMLAGMDQQLKEIKFAEKAKALNLTVRQALTIASMIEREAKTDHDRPLISSVIHNRLKQGMKLQIDATVEYALGGHREKIYYKDLEVDSPYNTYKYNGLPPGPIACPGKESLLAAVNPPTTQYLYYVAKPDGSHAFATTLQEHEANKKKYLK